MTITASTATVASTHPNEQAISGHRILSSPPGSDYSSFRLHLLEALYRSLEAFHSFIAYRLCYADTVQVDFLVASGRLVRKSDLRAPLLKTHLMPIVLQSVLQFIPNCPVMQPESS